MLKKIGLKNFRSIKNFKFDFTKQNNNHIYFLAENGLGKTSILESIYFTNTTKSHRTSDEKEIITFNEPFSKVDVLHKNNHLEIIITPEGKRTFVNKKEINKLSEFIGLVPLVLFSPEDFKIINGTPGNKRYFLDVELTQLSKRYLELLSDYRKIIKHRNNLLKTIKRNDDLTFLNILGDQLADYGTNIMNYRQQFIDDLNEYLKEFSVISMKIIYKPNVGKVEQYKQIIRSRTDQDFLFRTTSAGIHRDDFELQIDEEDGKKYASQGQKRLMVILLKLSLAKLLSKEKNEKVILLLDDVLSELDDNIQNELLKEVLTYDQVIMTGAIPINNKHFKTIELSKEMISSE